MKRPLKTQPVKNYTAVADAAKRHGSGGIFMARAMMMQIPHGWKSCCCFGAACYATNGNNTAPCICCMAMDAGLVESCEGCPNPECWDE